MAISARQASLQAQRSGYSPYGSAGRIRLLTPSNNAVASIAKKTANSEMEIMVAKYNAGQISNTEMRDFLTKMQSNIGISEADRNDIAIQIKDFDSRVVKDNLETRFKAAPDNSLQQVQAAQALSQYYRSRAETMQPDTPAYIDNIQAADAYDEKVVDIGTKIKTEARRNQRYIIEQQVNQIPSNTSERASANADKWKQLYDQAVADGDMSDANKFASYYQAELTKANELSTRETASGNKKTLTDFINTTLNDYHDGKISGEDALTALQEADAFAYDIGDVSAQNRVNSIGITIAREIEKGITYSNVGGISTKSKGGGGGGTGELYLNPDGSVSYGGGSGKSTGGTTKTSGGNVTGGKAPTGKGGIQNTGFTNGNETPKTFAQLDVEYQNNLQAANKDLVAGKINANQYIQVMSALTKSRQIDLEQITTGLDTIVQQDPTSKVGKKAIEALNKYDKELGNVTSEYNDLRTGRLVVGMKTGDFTDPTGRSISKQMIQLIPKDQKSVNVNGVHYKPVLENLQFGNVQDAQAFIKNNAFEDHKVTRGQDGKFYVTDATGGAVQGNVLHVNDTNGNDIIYQDEGSGFLPVALGPKTSALRARHIEENAIANKTGNPSTAKLLNFNDINKYDFSTPIIKPAEGPSKKEKIGNVVEGAKEVVSKVVAPLNPEIPQFKPSSELNLPQGPIQPQMDTQRVINSYTPQQPTQNTQPKLSLAGAVSPVAQNIQKAVNPTGAKATQIKIASPAGLPTISKPQDGALAKIVKGIGTKIKGWFN